MLVLQLVRIFSDVLTTWQLVALLYVFEIEEDLMFFAHVVRPIVDRSAIGSRSLHHVDHHSRNINFVSSRKWLLLNCLVFCNSTDSCGVLTLLLLKEGGDSVLSSKLFPCFFRQVVNHFTSEPYTRHGVQYNLVGDHVAYTQHFTVETCFNSVNVLAFPQACCNHGSAEVYEHWSWQTADKLLNYIWVCSAESPS